MSMVSGPKLDQMKQGLVNWWLALRPRLMAALEEGYPYRSIELSPDEQIQKFVSMQGPDWDNLTARLMERFRGEPDQENLVRTEMQRYQERMFNLMRRR